MSYAQMERELRGLFGLMDGLELQWITNSEIDLSATFQVLFDAIVARWRVSESARTVVYEII